MSATEDTADHAVSAANLSKEPIVALHEQLLGWRPKKDGTAYERLAALVLAGLGWEQIKQESHEQPPGAWQSRCLMSSPVIQTARGDGSSSNASITSSSSARGSWTRSSVWGFSSGTSTWR